MRRDAYEAALVRFLHAYLPRLPDDPRWPWPAERQAFVDRIAALEAELAVIKGSRLLKLGRWLRRLTGRSLPY